MDTATQTHLTQLRELLSYRLDQLRAEVRADLQVQQADGPRDDVGDRTDDASRLQQAGVDDAQAARDVQELRSTERALQRMEAGTYGDCLLCGEPVGLQRLLVQPDAEHCAACQTSLEEHRPRAGSTI
jgi:RNA polymerase-binding transcription factor DksA